MTKIGQEYDVHSNPRTINGPNANRGDWVTELGIKARNILKDPRALLRAADRLTAEQIRAGYDMQDLAGDHRELSDTTLGNLGRSVRQSKMIA